MDGDGFEFLATLAIIPKIAPHAREDLVMRHSEDQSATSISCL